MLGRMTPRPGDTRHYTRRLSPRPPGFSASSFTCHQPKSEPTPREEERGAPTPPVWSSPMTEEMRNVQRAPSDDQESSRAKVITPGAAALADYGSTIRTIRAMGPRSMIERIISIITARHRRGIRRGRQAGSSASPRRARSSAPCNPSLYRFAKRRTLERVTLSRRRVCRDS